MFVILNKFKINFAVLAVAIFLPVLSKAADESGPRAEREEVQT